MGRSLITVSTPVRTQQTARELVLRAVSAFRNEGTLLPVTLLLRAAFLVEVAIRPLVRHGEDGPLHLALWWPTVAAFGLYWLILLGSYLQKRHNAYFWSPHAKRAQIIFDTSFFGLFYVLNGHPESNLVLAFWLPLMIAARYFSMRAIITVLASVVAVIGGTLLWLYIGQSSLSSEHSPWRIFVLRSLLFVCVTWPLVRSEGLYRRLKQQTADYRRRMDLLVRRVKLVQSQRMDDLVEAAIDTARSELRAEVVSLFIYDGGVFRRLRSVGVDNQWFAEEVYAPGQGITGQVGVGAGGHPFGDAICNNQVAADPAACHDCILRYVATLGSGRLNHLVAVPLDGANRTFGILRAMNKLGDDGKLDPRGFTERDQHNLSSIAALLALGYASLRRERKTQAILDMTELAATAKSTPVICERIVELAADLGYAVSCLWLRGGHDQLRLHAAYGLDGVAQARFAQIEAPLPEQLSVLRSAATQVIADLQNDKRSTIGTLACDISLRSVLRLPLMHQQRVIGILELYTDMHHVFYPDEVAMLEAFAGKAAMTVVGARLAEQYQDQIRRLTQLADLISSISACADHDTLFNRVADKAAALVNAEDCSIFWVNRESQTIDLCASHCLPRRIFKQRTALVSRAPKAGLPAYVAATGESLSFLGEAYRQHPAWNGEFLEHLAYLPSKQCRSLMITPIVDQCGQIRGVIKIENRRAAGWEQGAGESDRELLDLLATQIAIAVDKIDQIARLQHLNRAARTITETGELRQVLQQITCTAREFAQADVSLICPYDPETRELQVDQASIAGQHTTARLSAKPRESGLTHEVLLSPSGYTVVSNLDEEPEKRSDFSEREGVKAFIAVALRVRNRPVGILYYDYRRPRQFTEEEIRNAQALGELAAIAISNAGLLTREKRTVQELTAVHALTKIALAKVDLASVLEVVVNTIGTTLGFEICTVSLVNEAEHTIETRKAYGIPEEWVAQARHSLDCADIQSYIVNTGETEIITGYDPRLDRDMYARFNQERFVRIFTPIGQRGRVIGTVEAGYDRANKPTIEPHELQRLQRYLEPVALVIENALLLEQSDLRAAHLQRFHDVSQQMDRALSEQNIVKVLQLAADGVSAVMGQGVASAICTCTRPHERQQLTAWAGQPRDAIEQHPLFTALEHDHVLATNERRVAEGRRVSQDGTPFVCAPLTIGGEVFGTLAVMFERDHWFLPDELKIIELCAAQAATAISMAREHERLNRRLGQIADDIEQSYHAAIGQPIVNIAGTFDILLNDHAPLGPLTEPQRDRIQRAQENVGRLRRQLRRLLLARQLEEDRIQLAVQPVKLTGLITEAVKKIEPIYREKEIRLTWLCDRAIEPLELDRDQIHEVLGDLLLNAYKFTPTGGTVQVWAEAQANHVQIAVCDSGRGVAVEDREKIFEKYVQLPPLLSNRESGAGLGLYLAKKIMEGHGGTITLDSRLGKGSTFTLTFPRSSDEVGGCRDDEIRRPVDRHHRRRSRLHAADCRSA
jgi:signal transduction histidine kinase/signal transduction protein with GAF and PtsI domain